MNCLTPKEIAEILKISYEQALNFIKYSGINYIKLGTQYRVEENKLKAFLTQNGNIEVTLNEKLNVSDIYNIKKHKKNKERWS